MKKRKQGWPPPKKSLGQVLLVDADMAREIVVRAGFNKEDRVLEIGPGRGILTSFLLDRKVDTTCCEIDHRMTELLEKRFSSHPQFKLILQDVMKLGEDEVFPGQTYHILGNLPYHLTSEIFFKFFHQIRRSWEAGNPPRLDSMIFMVQKEVAERLLSAPGTKLWGILSIQTSLFTAVEHVVDVPPEHFKPVPKVDSTVIRLTARKSPPCKIDSYQNFTEVIRTAFGNRRKMLKNTLSKYTFTDDMHIDLTRRPEELSAGDFAEIANNIIPM